MQAGSTSEIDVATAERLARLALDCVHREYPNKIAHVMESDADALPPRKLTPAFFGCFDWHSAVHGHWMLLRLLRLLHLRVLHPLGRKVTSRLPGRNQRQTAG